MTKLLLKPHAFYVFLIFLFSMSLAQGQPTSFTENFIGPSLDSAWNQVGNPVSHPNAISGTYDITHAQGDPFGGTKLSRTTGGTVGDFTHQIELVLDPHLLGGGGGTQTDFKWKSGGSDGLLEVVYNSFGNIRVNHFDFNTNSNGHIAGGSPDNIDIGYADGDTLLLTANYNSTADTVDVTYALNGGSPVNIYSGNGIDGQFGDVVTNFVEVEIFKFGSNLADQTIAAIDNWSLSTSSTPVVDADYNENGIVDAADYTLWRDNEGQTVIPGTGADGISDGTIDQLDYNHWVLQYGTSVPATLFSTKPVPEPGSCILGLLGFAFFITCRENQ